MAISNDGVFDTETWEAYSTTKGWTLSAEDGVKTVYVKFKDAAGNESDVVTDTITLITTGSISDVKSYTDGTPVSIKGAIVSASFDGFFYIESDKRESGIRVEKAGHTLSVGQRADISGTMGTNSNGERCILAYAAVQNASPNNTDSVNPVGMANKALGGGDWNYLQVDIWPATLSGQIGVTGGFGVNNIGLLVRVWGRVTEYEKVHGHTNPTWFIIDDGSGVEVKCIIPSGVAFKRGRHHVTVTGISSCEKVGNELHRVLLIRPGEVIMHN